MKNKRARYAAIKRLISKKNIHNQDELLALLKNEGFIVTQATLSRDLKFLKVGKVPDGRGDYLYSFPDEDSRAGSEASLVSDFMRGFILLQFSNGLGLIKTLSGHANSVAFALDHLAIPEVLGTIAGDDTILVIPKNGVTKDELLKGFLSKMPELEERVV